MEVNREWDPVERARDEGGEERVRAEAACAHGVSRTWGLRITCDGHHDLLHDQQVRWRDVNMESSPLTLPDVRAFSLSSDYRTHAWVILRRLIVEHKSDPNEEVGHRKESSRGRKA